MSNLDFESDDPEDYELFHHGVKGMKWGVRRPVGPNGLISRRAAKGKLKEERSTKQSNAVKSVSKAEERANAVYDKERAKARESGKGRLASHRAAMNSKAYQDANKKVEKAEDRSVSAAKKADADYKKGLQNDKLARREAKQAPAKAREEANKRVAKSEEKADSVYNTEYKKARDSGKGRIAARKAANSSKTYKEAIKNLQKEEEIAISVLNKKTKQR